MSTEEGREGEISREAAVFSQPKLKEKDERCGRVDKKGRNERGTSLIDGERKKYNL